MDKQDIVDKLEQLCHPMAEALSDYDRINAFVHVGNEAIEEIKGLRAELEYHLKQRNLWRGELPGVGKEWGTKPATQDQVDEIVGKSYF